MMTDRRTQAYAVRTEDHTLPPYHRRRRCRSCFFRGAVLVGLLLPGAARGAESAPLRVVVEGQIEAPFESVRAALLDLEGFGGWFPSTEEWRVLTRDPDSALVYGRLALPWPIDDRDYVARYSWRDAPDAFVLEARGVSDAEPRPRAGIVRVESMRTVWRIEPEGSATAVRYVYEGSPGGVLPDWVARIGWEMQTGILMDALGEEVERRGEREQVARPAAAREPDPGPDAGGVRSADGSPSRPRP